MGVEDLLEKVLLEAEMPDLKANPNHNATGSIIESLHLTRTWLCSYGIGI